MRFFFITLVLLCTSNLVAQKLDFNEVVKSEGNVNIFEDYLVYLAWLNHPTSEILNSKLTIASTEIKTEKAAYWEVFNPFVSYSSGNIDGLTTTIVNPLPSETPMTANDGTSTGFTVGLSLRLSPLFTTGSRVKMAEENVKIASADLNSGKLAIRAKVLSLYTQWAMQQQIAAERVKVEEERKENQQLILELFKQDGAEYEEVNTAASEYHKATEERVRAEMEAELAKIELEQWIGISLEAARLEFDSLGKG